MYRLEIWEYVKLIVVTEVRCVGDYLQTSGAGCLCTVFRKEEIDMLSGAGSGQIRGDVLKTVRTGALVTH